MEEQVLISLAILKANLEDGKTYIDNFIPFLLEAVWSQSNEIITLIELETIFRESFGLVLPQGVLKTVLRRASRLGHVTAFEKTYRRNEDKKPKHDFSKARDMTLRQYEALVDHFVKFYTSFMNYSPQREIAERAFLQYIANHSSDILANNLRSMSTEHTTEDAIDSYILCKFIIHLEQSYPSDFQFLETIVKGSMLADAMYLTNIDHISTGYKDLEVYFDTKILLRALGFEGDAVKAPYRELINMVYWQGGTPACFEHTVDEIYRVLDGAAHTLASSTGLKSSHGGVYEYFLTSDYKSSDVHLMMSKLPRILSSIRIKVKPSPPFKEVHSINESNLQDKLKQLIRYRKDEALYHDVDSIASIFRLRKGQFPRHLESSNAVFATTNYSLVEACIQFLKDEYGSASAFVPVCISDSALTTITWLKNQTSAPDLPRKRIIADCYAALNPSSELWNKYLEQIYKLRNDNDISTEDYFLLRLSTEARVLFMDITLGDEDAFLDGTVQEVLERARASIRAGTEAALKEEEKLRSKAEVEVEQEKQKRKADQQVLNEKIESLSKYVGSITTRWIPRVVAIAAAVGFVQSLPDEIRELYNIPSSTIFPIIFGFVSLLSILFQSNIFSLGRYVELKVAGLIKNKLTEYFLR